MPELFLAKRSDGLLEPVDSATSEIIGKLKPGEYLLATGKKATRSAIMNNCLHKYCELLADKLNDAGYDMLKVLKPGANIPWSKHTIKELIWRPFQRALCDKESTTEPTNEEYKKTYEALNRHLAESTGVSVSWPNRYGD